MSLKKHFTLWKPPSSKAMKLTEQDTLFTFSRESGEKINYVVMDSYFNFTLDENFDEHISSLNRESYSYNSFS